MPDELRCQLCLPPSDPPHGKYGGRRKDGVEWRDGWSCKLTFACYFFGYVNAPTANAGKRWFSSMHPKRVLVVDAFRWGHFAQRIKSLLFYTQKPFSLGKLRLKVSVRLKHLTIFSYSEQIFWSETQKCYTKFRREVNSSLLSQHHSGTWWPNY